MVYPVLIMSEIASLYNLFTTKIYLFTAKIFYELVVPREAKQLLLLFLEGILYCNYYLMHFFNFFKNPV